MDRVRQGTTGTISNAWYSNGVVVDPGSVTIGIVRADGTVLVSPGTATSGSGATPRTFNLTTTHTATLDHLLATWTSSTQGTALTHFEIVGGRLFTIAEALARPQLASMMPANIEIARIRAEQYLERRCGGRSFFPQYAFERHPIDGILIVDHPDIRTVRSVKVGETQFDSNQLASLVWMGSVISGVNWAIGRAKWTPVLVGYEYGDDTPEEPVKDAALDLAEDYLTAVAAQDGIDPRATRITTSEGTISFGRDIRAVELVVNEYSLGPLMI